MNNQEVIKRKIIENKSESIIKEIKKLEKQIKYENRDLSKLKIEIDQLALKITKENIDKIYSNLSKPRAKIEQVIINSFISIIIGDNEIIPEIVELYLRNHSNLISRIKQFPLHKSSLEQVNFISKEISSVSESFWKNGSISKSKIKNYDYLFPLYEWTNHAINYVRNMLLIELEKQNNQTIQDKIEELNSSLRIMKNGDYTIDDSEIMNISYVNEIINKLFQRTNPKTSNNVILNFNIDLGLAISKYNNEVQDLYLYWGKEQKNILTSSIVTRDVSMKCRPIYCSFYACFNS